MSNEHTEENLELILYINNLRKTFNRKLDDQLVLIGEQRERIDFQQQLIGEQRITMDELAWQIRDLRDSVRQCCEKIEKYEVQLREQCCECHHDDNSNKKNSNNKIDVNNNNNNSFSCTNKTCGDVNRREKLCRQHHVQGRIFIYMELFNCVCVETNIQVRFPSVDVKKRNYISCLQHVSNAL